MDTTSFSEFHRRIVRDTFSQGMSDEGALLLFTVLHCYQIELAGPVLSDCTVARAGTCIAAITQRDCGEAVAEMWVWAGADVPQADYTYWYRLWNERGAYSQFDELTCSERSRMRWLISELEKHPFVTRLVPEDFDPASNPQ